MWLEPHQIHFGCEGLGGGGDGSDYPEIVFPISGSMPRSLNGEPSLSPSMPVVLESFPPSPKDVHIQILRACEYIILHGKGHLRWQMELMLLITLP